jgi:hypothetical protein
MIIHFPSAFAATRATLDRLTKAPPSEPAAIFLLPVVRVERDPDGGAPANRSSCDPSR